MSPPKQSGFSLFPQPPTPPARRNRANTKSSTTSSERSVQGRWTPERSHARKSSTSAASQTSQPDLIPAPLKIRRAREEIPPVPALLPPFPPRASDAPEQGSTPPKTPNNGIPQLPAIPQSSPFALSPRTPPRGQHFRMRTRVIAESIELDAGYRKRASSRLSQWLDLEDGEVNQRRLSKYLGSVLDNTFEVPTFESENGAPMTIQRRISKYELQSVVEQCECPPDAIICHCSSSPEFERFRSWSHQRQKSSISSTACLVGVPRARFQSAFFIPEPTIAELPSPPGLAYDTEDNASDSGDWITPRTPSRDDIFSMPSSRGRSYSHKYSLHSPPSEPSTQSRVQSFSRPFRPDSTYRAAVLGDSQPSTPSGRYSRSTNPKSGYLTSISTVSSFDFAFDFKSRVQSLNRQQQSELESRDEFSGDREQSNHLRTDSNESILSQTSLPELSTATAAVAMRTSNVKPLLVSHNLKRNKTPSTACSQGSTSVSASAKTSTSSLSIPEYWHHFNTGLQSHARSDTVATSATNESAAFSAKLSGPLLSPKGIQHLSGPLTMFESSPVAGNAFAQRSNTTATMPLLSTRNELSSFNFDTTEQQGEQPLYRSNTTPHLTSYNGFQTRTESNAYPYSPDDYLFDNHDNENENENDHIQAHILAAARLKAYMDSLAHVPKNSSNSSNNSNNKSEAIDHGYSDKQVKRRTKNYSFTDEQHQQHQRHTVVNRDDSGIFGRMSTQFGGNQSARRGFTEPQFYRRLDMN